MSAMIVIVSDPCSSNPCGYGKCLATRGNSYRCQCKTPYTGSHCQLLIYQGSSLTAFNMY